MCRIYDLEDQYRELNDRETWNLMEAAKKLWPLIMELGDNYECETEDFVVIIKRRQAGQKGR